MAPSRVAFSLGSNLGDREAHLQYAIDRLRTRFSDLVVSRFIETEPVGIDPQPKFLNAAAVATTDASPEDTLEVLLSIERERGRTRPHAGAPRTLDLDVIVFGNLIVLTPTLKIPHPRFRERLFVLEPLADIEPGMVDPVTGKTIVELLALART